jgi:hypothetical protein
VRSLKGEVLGVEVMDAHVAVLAAAREGAPVGVEGDRVDGAEVPLDLADLRLVNLVEECCLHSAARVSACQCPCQHVCAAHVYPDSSASAVCLYTSTHACLYMRVYEYIRVCCNMREC